MGQDGETLAERFLKQQGHRIIEKNWRCRLGEIDLITTHGRDLHFVEVKTRHTDRYGSPLLAITAHKQAKLRRLAEAYLAHHFPARPFANLNFSCLGIRMTSGTPEFDWRPGGFGV